MDYYLVITPAAEPETAELDKFFEHQQALWSDVSRRWIEFRSLPNQTTGNRRRRPESRRSVGRVRRCCGMTAYSSA
jgi:hypothetical protein